MASARWAASANPSRRRPLESRPPPIPSMPSSGWIPKKRSGCWASTTGYSPASPPEVDRRPVSSNHVVRLCPSWSLRVLRVTLLRLPFGQPATANYNIAMPAPIPDFLYGTAWKEERTAALTELAIRSGFRAIDTANQRKHYVEEGAGAGIAVAVRAGLVTRDDLFLQTKFTYLTGQDHRLPYDPAAPFAAQVAQSLV